jgi:hypothetical protein
LARSYVLVDPTDGDDSKDSSAKKAAKRGKALVLIAVAVAAGVAATSIPMALRQHYESPDRP